MSGVRERAIGTERETHRILSDRFLCLPISLVTRGREGAIMRLESGARSTRPARLKKTQSRARRKNVVVNVPRNKLNFPSSMKTTLRYTERQEFSPHTNVANAAFRANDLFDPLFSTGGHQPRGFDEFMGIYKAFTVTSSKISVRFMYEGYNGPSTKATLGNLVQNAGADSSEPPALTPVVMGITKTVGNVIEGGTAVQQMERDRSTWNFINSGDTAGTITASTNVTDMFGKQFAIGAEGYTGSDSAGPTEEILYNVWCARVSDDYPEESVKIVAFVTVTYEATFTEPKQLASS